MSFLELEHKNILIMGVSNKRSVGWAIARQLEAEGANVYLSVRNAEKELAVRKFADPKVFSTVMSKTKTLSSPWEQNVANSGSFFTESYTR